MTHTVDPQLLERPIRILVVGCGGNGSAVVSGLPYLPQALLAFGHPGGLQVTLGKVQGTEVEGFEGPGSDAPPPGRFSAGLARQDAVCQG